MNEFAAFSDRRLCQTLAEQIAEQTPPQPVALMEVCGTHTMAIFQSGLRDLLPENVTLLPSGAFATFFLCQFPCLSLCFLLRCTP